MSSQTYKVRALVLRKTKLSDKDLIVTMLDESGQLVQGVAKGARKPGGSFAARLELFSCVDVMMAKGRSLDVVCEARLVDSGVLVAFDLEQSTCASPLAELLGVIAQPGLEQTRLFDLARASFDRIAHLQGKPQACLAITAAGLLKIMGQVGYRPSFTSCVVCARPVGLSGLQGKVPVSVVEGGVICSTCPRAADSILVDAQVLQWCDALIRSRYDDIESMEMTLNTCFSVLQFGRTWIRTHTGRNLKSLDFLFTSGLFA